MNKSHSGSLVHTPGVPEPLQEQPELDLYEDLTVFTDLSPEQRKQQLAQQLAQTASAPPKSSSSNSHYNASMNDSGFEVIEMSKTRPLIRKPAAKPETKPPADGVCYSCGAANTPGDLFCESCGAFLEDPQPAPLPGASMPSPSMTSMNCSDCGAAVGPAEVFCPSCGSVMDSN